MKGKQIRKEGFTIAELLIVIAVIGVLVAISIAIFTSKLTESRIAADRANVRSAKAAALAEWMNEGMSGEMQFFYDAAAGVVKEDSSGITGYGKYDKSDKADVIGASGIPNKEGNARFLMIDIDSEGEATLSWYEGTVSAYAAAVASYKGKDVSELKQMPNDERVAADQTTLRLIAEAILAKGWTLQELKDNLKIKLEGDTVRIANFYQRKTGDYSGDDTYHSLRFDLHSTEGLRQILADIGYEGGSQTPTGRAQTYGEEIAFANSLFYSDELGAIKFHDYPIEQSMRSIIIQNVHTDSEGKIDSLKIFAKAMNNEANMDNAEKAKFEMTVHR